MFAALGGLAAGISAITVRRYAGTLAGLLTGLLFAVHVPAQWYSYWVFNPGVAQVFIALWLYSGLRGYLENQRGWVVVHGLMLAVCIQLQPANVLMAPISIVLLLASLWHWRTMRWRIVGTSIVTAVLSFLTFLPWILGTFLPETFVTESPPPPPSSVALFTSTLTPRQLLETHGTVSGTWQFAFERSVSSDAVVWPPAVIEANLALAGPVVVALAALLVLWMWWQQPWHRLPWLIFVLLAFVPFALAFAISQTFLQAFYFVMLMFGILPLYGIVLALLWRWHIVTRVLAAIVLILLVGFNLWTTAANFRYRIEESWQSPLDMPLYQADAIMGELHDAAGDNGDITVIVDELYGRFNTIDELHIYFWSIVGDRYGVRIVPRYHLGGVPLAEDHDTLLVSGAIGSTIPRLSDDVMRFGTTDTGEGPLFQRSPVSADDFAGAYDYVPEASPVFDNGATLLGLYADSAPQAGQPWPVLLVWDVTRNDQSINYQFSLRVENADGTVRHAQQDQRALDSSLWRAQDIVVSPFSLSFSDDYDGGPVRLQVLMYDSEGSGNASVLDDTGNPAGQWVYLQQATR